MQSKYYEIPLPMGGHPADGLLTAGQPTPADFEALAAAGLFHVISLRPNDEDPGFGEAALVRRLGLRYTVIPVAGPDDLNMGRVIELDKALQASNGAPTLIHCASSNRVGALLALRGCWLKALPVEEALALGRSAGLTKMESLVKTLLQSMPNEPS